MNIVTFFQFTVGRNARDLFTAIKVSDKGVSYWSVLYFDQNLNVSETRYLNSSVSNFLKDNQWTPLF